MKSEKNILLKLSLFGLICMFSAIIYNIVYSPKLTHIEKVIKNHNSIRESLKNPSHPTISKPSSSQIGIVGGDSVRVIKIVK